MFINKNYEIKPIDEANNITEAFGIEGGYKNVIFSDLYFPEELPSIIYITGESGCGKTTILKELGYNEEIINIPEEPLFMWCGDEMKSLSLMSMVGLSDATLFVSTYNELSDSQKARARIYYHLISEIEVIVVDEFLSTLDRKTAMSVAYSIQKAIRKEKKKLIAVTAHNDLEEYLQPDLCYKGKSFPSRWEIKEGRLFKGNPYIERIKFRYEDKVWYRNNNLGSLHYKGKYTGGTKEYLVMSLDGEDIGFILGTYRMSDGGRRISRFVLHPSYRSIGLGQLLIKRYLRDFPNADVISVMGKYNKVFENSGMKRVDDVIIKEPKDILKSIELLGFDKLNWYSRSYCKSFCQSEEVRKTIANYSDKLSYLVCPGGVYLPKEEVAKIIVNNKDLCGRVLWNVRPKTMAKYVNKFDISEIKEVEKTEEKDLQMDIFYYFDDLGI